MFQGVRPVPAVTEIIESDKKRKGVGRAVPEMEKIQEKWDGDAFGRPRNGENRRKRGRRCAWLSPK
ncbi:hypothetical protein J8TS2_28910 [Lederbergia ruris]|uniref:Uncharacterized protein n=1 Tax=Lederbergia ruris TaxID=217495 RepID=A0ABQ4KKU4_9BACI|nr:hypothetical protein J8TS2_28910 [Lederbergia ruris]